MNYRIFFVPAMELSHNTFEAEFETLKEAKAALDLIADYTLRLQELVVMRDYSNYGYIEQFIDGEWVELDEDEE